MPSDPLSGPPSRSGAGARGPGRAVRATRALVAVVLAVLVLVTVLTALLGGDDSGERAAAGDPAVPPPPVAVPGLPPLLAPLRDLDAGPEPGAPDPDGLARALAPLLADPALGPRVGAAVVDAATGELLLRVAPPGDPAVIPASTSKLVTAAAALATLDPARRFETRVLAGPPGVLTLVGGGDPTLASPAADPAPSYAGSPPARLAALADATAAALSAREVGVVDRLTVDASLFGPPESPPGWKPTYLSHGNVAPVVALSVDAGRVRPGRAARHVEPDLAAGAAFAALLTERGVPVDEVVRGPAPAGAELLAAAESPPVADLVEAMVSSSDNDLAEALARHVALAGGLPATAAGAAEAVRAAVAALGVPADAVTVADGSGLSRDSRVRPEAVAELVALASREEGARLRPLVTGLPVAGFGGTLAERYRAGEPEAAAGSVRAKTGTLSGVSALAGLVVDAEGRLLAFDVTADAVPTADPRPAEAALDRLVATLAACGCD